MEFFLNVRMLDTVCPRLDVSVNELEHKRMGIDDQSQFRGDGYETCFISKLQNESAPGPARALDGIE